MYVIRFRLITRFNLATPRRPNQDHTSTARKNIENEHQLIIFGTTLMVVAAIVFIAKNRESAKVMIHVKNIFNSVC